MRSHWEVTWSVWQALFMREILARTTGDRLGWFWLLGEPVAFMAIMSAVRSLAWRTQGIVGADFIPWLVVGLLGFFLFRDGLMRSLTAVQSSQALFAYRQVKAVDPVLVRAGVDGILRSLVLVVLLAIGLLVGIDALPAHPLEALFVWLSIWLLGLGCGLVVSVAARLVPDVEPFVKMLGLPLMILSGAIFPLHNIPHQFLQYLLYNPVMHGLEMLRVEFFPGYQVVGGTHLEYLWYWNFATLALGLALHVRFAERLKAQ
ncbi:ABC transporter permease [Thiocystis violacea]|uniref:ABC transporter permease n=1 Tax=Thiocystis violacea TaxID=13725 RepID=UPI00190420B7|nr:ABC transporter permease [Thiocystis violacea]MBK1723528.1 ABC transporter permease [Thiocystis violacea]